MSLGRRLGGSVLAIAGLIGVALFWPTFTFVFEDAMPADVDVSQYEQKPQYSPDQRYVRLTGAEIYTLEHVAIPDGKGIDHFFPLVGGLNPIRNALAARNDLARQGHEKAQNLFANPPDLKVCRFVLISRDASLAKAIRESPLSATAQMVMPQSADPLSDRAIDGVVGVVERFEDLPFDTQEALSHAGFLDKTQGQFDAIFVRIDSVPPHPALSIATFVLPAFALTYGLWIALVLPRAQWSAGGGSRPAAARARRRSTVSTQAPADLAPRPPASSPQPARRS